MTHRKMNSAFLSTIIRGTKAVWAWRYLIPISPLGLIVFGIALYLYRRYSTAQMDVVLHSGALLVLVIVTVSVLFVLLAALALSTKIRRELLRDRERGDLPLESGVRTVTGVRFPKLSGWPLVTMRLEWVRPSAVSVEFEVEEASWMEIVTPQERGREKEIVRRVVVSDVFGFSRFGLTFKTPKRVVIRPSTARVTGHVLRQLIGGDALSFPKGAMVGEYLDMRRYVHGDSLKHVLWRVYARSRQLMVRTPERAIEPSPSAVAYFVAGPRDEATASAARFFVEGGLLGKEFIFGADGGLEPATTTERALDLLIDSVDFRSSGGAQLFSFLNKIEISRRKGCVLFLPPVSGAWLSRVQQAAHDLAGGTAIIAIDVQPRVTTPQRLREFFFDDPNSAARNDKAYRALPNLVTTLRTIGLHVHVIHRPTGEFIAPVQLEALAR